MTIRRPTPGEMGYLTTKKRRIIYVGLGAFGALCLILMARACLIADRVAGIYLAEGGTACLVVEKQGLKGWQVAENYLDTEWELRVLSVWPRLRLDARYSQAYALSGFNLSWKGYMILVPSRRGDWDIIAYNDDAPTSLPTPNDSWFRRLLGPWLPAPRPPAPPPLPQPAPFLHRINDHRIVGYFDLQVRQAPPDQAHAIAQLLLKDYPDDLYIRSLYLQAAASCSDAAEVERRLVEWREGFENASDPFLRWAYAQYREWLWSRQLTAAGRNAFDLHAKVFGGQNELDKMLRMILEFLKMDAWSPPRPPGQPWGGVPNWLETSVQAKNCQVIAYFWMMEGKRSQSLDLLAACYRLGQMMNDGRGGTILIERLIGALLRGIACRGLEVFALNCCETEAEFRELWKMLDVLEKWQRAGPPNDTVTTEDPIRLCLRLKPNRYTTESWTRYSVVDARFELVRAGAAAKHRQVARGDFPQSENEFSPPLVGGLPQDPFSTGPLRFAPAADSLLCYSVGPDRQDNQGTIEYDPTNGTVSVGDLVVRVPRQRQYPFPRSGVRADSIDDLVRQFPNGLPPDPFATTRGKPLGTTQTVSGDIYVYSYGPDVDQFKTMPSASRVPQCHYDPTNGTISEGDLFIRIPRP